jgi:hypothetical protein
VALRDQLAAAFLDLSSERQTELLEYQWPTLAGATMAPALRVLVDRSAASGALRDLALRRLFAVAPEEGRARILREIRRPGRGATLKTLGLLPDRELPELDDVLAGHLEADDDFEAMTIRAELLHRYATPAVSARVLSQVAERLTGMACQPKAALIAYFVRADPDVGDALLTAALASRATTGCHTSLLRDVSALRMTPGIEAVAVTHLNDPDPQVVASAADTLGRHGSELAAQALRASFERWRRTWDGRPEALRHTWTADRSDASQGMVESTLLQAIVRGQAWRTDADGVRDVRTLCVTDNCRTQADQLIEAADDTRINIIAVEKSEPSLIFLAQYHLTSIAALEQKLAQYPDGTRFTLDLSALEPAVASAVEAGLRTFAAAHAFTFQREPGV